MTNHHQIGSGDAPSIYSSGVIENAIRKGRRLRAEAIRNAFHHLRPTLGPSD